MEKFLTTWCTIVLLLFALNSRAQELKINGVVKSSTDGQPISGASIKVKNSSKGTKTNEQGGFTLAVQKSDVLLISAVGFDGTQVTVINENNINISLKENANELDQVVVTGYSKQKKKDLAGAVAVVNVADLNKQPTASVNNQLQGQASGVTVIGSGQPGQQPQIRIRGFNSFGNNSPLYVIDGVPTLSINDLNPNDVESMQVLKDAASASIYGSRAANGVIIITTKKGKGKVKVSYDSYAGSQVPRTNNVYHLLNSSEMMQYKQLQLKNQGLPIQSSQYGTGTFRLPDYIIPTGAMEGDAGTNPNLYNVNPFYNNGSIPSNFYQIVKANKAGTDWYKEIVHTAPMMSHNVSVSGGNDMGNYLLSFNYFDQKGTLMNTYLKRYTLRSNSQFNVSKKLKIGENLAYSLIDNPQIAALTEGSGLGMAFREQPIIPVRDIMGNFAGTRANDLGNAKNPVAVQDRIKNNKGMNTRLFGNLFGEYSIIEGLTFRSSFGGELYQYSGRSFTFPEYENAENSLVNTYRQDKNDGYSYTWTNTFNYSKVIGKHDIKAIIGTEAIKNYYNNLWASRNNYFVFDPNFTNLDNGSSDRNNSSYFGTNKLFSYLFRLDYIFNQKYILGATLRRDGSSKFYNGDFNTSNLYAWFPSISFAWRVSDEDFMKNVKWVNDFKLRAGYGTVGNQLNVSDNNAFNAYGSNINNSYYPIGGGDVLTPGYALQGYGNPNAKWEKNINANIGFDATLFNNSIEINADYYRKDIQDLLFNPELTGTYGTATSFYKNIGKMTNSGLDLGIRGNFKAGNDWKFDALATITTYNNKIEKIADGANYFDQEGRRFNGSNIVRNQVGHSIGQFYGYKVVGFWNSQAEIDAANAKAPSGTYQSDVAVGRFKYQDVNGDGQISASDRTFIGNPNPKFTYGLNLGATYKNWDMSAFFYGSQGNDLWNNVIWWTDFGSFNGAASKTALYDSWTPTNTSATAPIQDGNGGFSKNQVPNSYFVQDGSYLRLKNVQIGYTFPVQLLSKYGVSKLRLYVSGANLFTITKYTGIDPEITSSTNTSFGIDEGNYANPRTFLFGLNVSF